jgi:hypothetical protein
MELASNVKAGVNTENDDTDQEADELISRQPKRPRTYTIGQRYETRF